MPVREAALSSAGRPCSAGGRGGVGKLDSGTLHVCFSLVWFGVWFGLVWFGLVWFGLVRFVYSSVQSRLVFFFFCLILGLFGVTCWSVDA